MIFVAIGIFVLYAYIQWRIEKSLLYPPILISVIWALFLLLAATTQIYDRLSDFTLTLYVAGIIGFGLGSVVALSVPLRIRRRDTGRVWYGDSVKPYIGLLIMGLMLLPLYLRHILWVASQIRPDNILLALRISQASDPRLGIGLYEYLISLMTFGAIAAVSQDNGSKRRRITSILLVLLALAYNIISASRTGIGILIFGITGTIMIRRSSNQLRKVAAAGILFGSLFIAIAIALGKLDVFGLTGHNWAESVGNMIRHYMVSGVIAFDHVVRDPYAYKDGFHSLRFFIAVANKMGAHYPVAPLVLDYTWIPYPTNVYTMFFPAYVDFGSIGLVSYAAILGMISCWVYRLARAGSAIAVGLYGLFFAKLLISGITEHFIVSMSYWIQAWIVFMVLLWAGKTRRAWRRTYG